MLSTFNDSNLYVDVTILLVYRCDLAYIIRKVDFFVCTLQADVILVDIDGGHLSIPDSINLPYLPEPFLSRARHELTLVSLETHFSL